VTLSAEDDGEATAGAEDRVLVRSVVKELVTEQAPKAVLQPVPQYLSPSVCLFNFRCGDGGLR
jgi:hypothetical protein